MIDGKNFFDQPINNDHKKHENIRKIATSQEDNYTTDCLLLLLLLLLFKRQVFYADPRAIQQINFTVN